MAARPRKRPAKRFRRKPQRPQPAAAPRAHAMALHITVPDHDSWGLFCADLVVAGKREWQRQHGNVVDDMTALPCTTAAPEVREDGPSATPDPPPKKTPQGRPNVLMRCWKALWKGLATDPRVTVALPDMQPFGPAPLINGQRITPRDVRELIRAHDTGQPPLSNAVYKKYGRTLFLAFWPDEYRAQDEHYMEKYFWSTLRRAGQQHSS